jgi:hypothetical protein
MRRPTAFAASVAAIVVVGSGVGAHAHGIVGNRFFPATLNVDDPFVADEFSMPTISVFRNGDDPSAKEVDVSSEVSKRITETFGISLAPTWTRLSPPGGPKASGFQNLETTFKYQFHKDPAHELIMSLGLSVEWGSTGARAVGAEAFTTYTPTFYIGKGFGDLPDTLRWLRPFAVTAQVGYAVPSSSSSVAFDPDTGAMGVDPHPQFVVWGATLQYSLPYLKSAVVDLGLPDLVNRLIPIVEASFKTPVANNVSGLTTTGTVNPGVIWVGDYYQVALEAVVPVNRQSGTGVGAMAQLHFFLDDIFPESIGKPIFTDAANAGRPTFGR